MKQMLCMIQRAKSDSGDLKRKIWMSKMHLTSVNTDVGEIEIMIDSDRHLTTREIGQTLDIIVVAVSRYLRQFGIIKKLDI